MWGFLREETESEKQKVYQRNYVKTKESATNYSIIGRWRFLVIKVRSRMKPIWYSFY